MSELQKSCLHVIAAVVLALIFGTDPGEDWVTWAVQIYCLLVFIINVPFLFVIGAWRYVGWQFAMFDRRRADAALAQQSPERIFSSMYFINGAVMLATGVTFGFLLVTFFNPGARTAFAELLNRVSGTGYWAVAQPIMYVCEILISLGLILMAIPLLRSAWRRVRARWNRKGGDFGDFQ